MAKQRFQITEQETDELRRAYRQTKDAATRTRYQAILLYVENYPVDEIGRITGCQRSSLMEWCQKYRQQGVDGLRDHRGGPHRAKLSNEQMVALGEKLHLYCPRDLLGADTHSASGQHWTVEDLVTAIQRWYGVTWDSRSSYHRLLAHCGFTYQRTEKVYKSRREHEVVDFEAAVEKN
jgi:transposase